MFWGRRRLPRQFRYNVNGVYAQIRRDAVLHHLNKELETHIENEKGWKSDGYPSGTRFTKLGRG